jgi:hypothetical protein
MTGRVCFICGYLESEHAGSKCLYSSSYFDETLCGVEIDRYPTEYCDGVLVSTGYIPEYEGYSVKCFKCGHADLLDRKR